MITSKTKWVLVGRVCLAAAAVAYVFLQGGLWESEAADPKLRELGTLPDGIRVIHTPNPVRAQVGGRSGFRYTWLYTTTVEAIDRPIVIEEFGAFEFHSGEWRFSTITGKPFTQADFAEWYSCPDSALKPGKKCSDPLNWTGSDRLRSERDLWYFIGRDSAGNRVKGQAIIERLGEISPAD